jgi:hypothetical protein
MGLKQIDKVDMVLKAPEGDEVDVLLVIVDDGSIVDERQREELFIAKLDTYGRYILAEGPARGRVCVLHRMAPSARMLQVTSICPGGHEDRRTPVVFEDYDAFMARPIPKRRLGHGQKTASVSQNARDNQPLQRTGAASKPSWLQRLFGRGPGR